MLKDTASFTGVSLCKKSGRIRIFHSTIKELGNPKYIRFLFNPEKKALVVQSCKKKEPECFHVPKYNPENWEFAIHSIPMLRMIWKVCEWEEDKTYRSDGMHYADHELVEFDLTRAEILMNDDIESAELQ